MNMAHIVTIYCQLSDGSIPPADKLPVYRFAIDESARGEIMAAACISALKTEHSDFEFSHDVRAIQFIGPHVQPFELVADVMETDL